VIAGECQHLITPRRQRNRQAAVLFASCESRAAGSGVLAVGEGDAGTIAERLRAQQLEALGRGSALSGQAVSLDRAVGRRRRGHSSSGIFFRFLEIDRLHFRHPGRGIEHGQAQLFQGDIGEIESIDRSIRLG